MERKNSRNLPWSITLWRRTKLFVAWITVAKLMTLSQSRTLPNQCLYVPPEFLGPVSRFRIAHIMPQANRASRASRPWLTVGLLRTFWNGLCTAHRFHAEGEAQCLDELDSVFDTTKNAVQLFGLSMVTIYCATTERPSFSRLDHPGFSTKPPTGNRTDGCHRCHRPRP